MIMLPTNFMPRFFKSFEMASDNGKLTLSTCPLHSLLRLQEKNNRSDAVWTCKHTNPIIFQPSASGLKKFTLRQLVDK